MLDNTKYRLKSKFWDSPSESFIYQIFLKIIDDNYYMVIPHLSLREIFERNDELELPFNDLSYLASHHVDFMIVRSKSLQPIVAIEINGSAHDSKGQQKKDAAKIRLFQTNKIPILTFTLTSDIPIDETFIKNRFIEIFDDLPAYCPNCQRMMEYHSGRKGDFYRCPNSNCKCKTDKTLPLTVSKSYIPYLFK